MTPKIFIAVGGQRDNVGDTALRRAYLDALRTVGELHVTLGSAPETYLHGLELDDRDTVYPDRQAWRSAAYKTAAREPVVYAFHVGEMILTTKLAVSYAKQLPMVSMVRLKRGVVLHCGLGLRGGIGRGIKDAIRLRMVRTVLRACTFVAWRDETSARLIGIGSVEPDWAFGAAPAGKVRSGHDADRRTLAVALRHDRDRPSDEYVSAVREYAEKRELRIVLTAQTERDLVPARENADRFGGSVVEWTSPSLDVAEKDLREVYRDCHTVVSNRLHGLAIAATEGALPIGLTTGDPEKLARTLDAAGISGICLDTRNATHRQVLDHLNAVDARSAEIGAAVERAQVRLQRHADELTGLVEAKLGKSRATAGVGTK